MAGRGGATAQGEGEDLKDSGSMVIHVRLQVDRKGNPTQHLAG